LRKWTNKNRYHTLLLSLADTKYAIRPTTKNTSSRQPIRTVSDHTKTTRPIVNKTMAKCINEGKIAVIDSPVTVASCIPDRSQEFPSLSSAVTIRESAAAASEDVKSMSLSGEKYLLASIAHSWVHSLPHMAPSAVRRLNERLENHRALIQTALGAARKGS